MNNDVLAEAISGLATAIRLLNWNNRSSEAAARVEEIIQSARNADHQLLAEMMSSWDANANARASRVAAAQESSTAADEPTRAPVPVVVEIEPGS